MNSSGTNIKHIISLGAGVQSSTMALMAAKGEIEPIPDCAIFADTGWEPQSVYRWLDWLEEQLPFPVYRVNNGNLREKLMSGGFNDIPAFILRDNKVGMGRRQCTWQFKVRPLRHKMREMGLKEVVVWIGISWDEMSRMKDADVKWIKHRWPLVEKEVRRADCYTWMCENGYPKPPRSACVGCPFKKNSEWQQLSSEEWMDAVEIDETIRHNGAYPQFLHPSCKPLSEAPIDRDTIDMFQTFEMECEGMCGV